MGSWQGNWWPMANDLWAYKAVVDQSLKWQVHVAFKNYFSPASLVLSLDKHRVFPHNLNVNSDIWTGEKLNKHLISGLCWEEIIKAVWEVFHCKCQCKMDLLLKQLRVFLFFNYHSLHLVVFYGCVLINSSQLGLGRNLTFLHSWDWK